MEPVKTGIIGFGRMAEDHHLKAMRKCGLYEVVGVCDVTASRRAAAQRRGLRATGDIDELLGWDVELVLIATHSCQHHADALKCAAAGKHMLIEKPLAATAADAEEMAAAAEDAGVVLSVYHNRHLDPDYLMVKSAVGAGLVGELVSVENRTAVSRPAVRFGTPEFNPNWRITAADGGGALLDFGPHWTEQILDLLAGRKVVQVFGDVRCVKWGDADDFFRIDMVFEGGVRAAAAKCDIAYYSPPDKWLVFGSEGTLHGPVGKGKRTCVVVNGPDDAEIRHSQMPDSVSLHANVARHVRGAEELIITPDHALRVMRVLQAARDSARAGKSVDVEI